MTVNILLKTQGPMVMSTNIPQSFQKGEIAIINMKILNINHTILFQNQQLELIQPLEPMITSQFSMKKEISKVQTSKANKVEKSNLLTLEGILLEVNSIKNNQEATYLQTMTSQRLRKLSLQKRERRR